MSVGIMGAQWPESFFFFREVFPSIGPPQLTIVNCGEQINNSKTIFLNTSPLLLQVNQLFSGYLNINSRINILLLLY